MKMDCQGIGQNGVDYTHVAGCCEQGKKMWSATKRGESLDRLKNISASQEGLCYMELVG
jgi:hypothetical protein